MEPKQLSIMARKVQSVLDASTLDTRGDHLKFCQRQRLITPCRFALSVVASMATKQVYSLADLHRDFNALWDMEVRYKAFYTQLAKAPGADFLRTSLGGLMGKLTLQVLGGQPGEAVSEFPRIIIQDGSSFAVHDALYHVFPGRFPSVTPAAVALHCTLEGVRAAPSPWCGARIPMPNTTIAPSLQVSTGLCSWLTGGPLI